MSSVLVAFATKYGSTQEVAEAVAAALKERGIDVDVRPAREVKALDGYSAVVLGAPLYYFRWHKDARKFLDHHRKALVGLPVAVFALGPFANEPDQFEDARGRLDKALAERDWLSPVAVEVFGGKFDSAGLRFPDANPGMKKIPASDIRDWEAIRAWASALPEVLGLGGRATAEPPETPGSTEQSGTYTEEAGG